MTIETEVPTERVDNMQAINPAVLDRGATARYLGLSVSTIAELTATGQLRSLKVGRRRLYRLADLDDWLLRKVEGTA